VARVALDADVLIAFLDAADAQHQAAVEGLRPRLAAGDEILLSASVYAEVMVRPVQDGSHAAVDEFLDAIKATAPIWKHEEWTGGADWGTGAHAPIDAASVPSPATETAAR